MSFKRYPAYKDSGAEWLGEVPCHWNLKRLKHNVHLLTEKTDRQDRPVALENIESWTGRFIQTETEFMGEGIAFNEGDILFGKLRPYLAKAYRAEFSGEAVGDFHVMQPATGIDSRFVQYQILNREFIDIVDGSTFGSKMPRASWEFVGSMMVTTPPLPEQAQIAAFLDRETAKIDGLVAEQRRLMTLLKEKRQTVISHAVTRGLDPDVPMKPSGIEWLGDVPAHWDCGGLTKFIGPIVDYRGRTPIKQESGIFLVTARNIKNGKIDYDASEEYVDAESAESLLQRGRPEIGDLLFTMEAPLGQAALIDRTDIALAQRIVKFRGKPNVMRSSFLLLWLMSEYCQAKLLTLATGSTALGIKSSKLGMIDCLVPPASEQAEIVVFVACESVKFDTLTAEAQRAIDLLQERRTALISAAVTGQIDVRDTAGSL